MATRDDCIRAARAAGDLSPEEAADVVDRLMAEKAKVNRAAAEGRIGNAEEALAAAWRQGMNEQRIRRALQKKHAAINILRRQDIDSFIGLAKEEGFGAADAIEALMVGSNKRFTGARHSADSQRQAIFKDAAGAMQNELETLGEEIMQSLKRDDAFKADVVREMISPQSTGSAEARGVADIFGRYMEMLRLRLNANGANIGKLDGYLPQSHDAWKLARRRPDGVSPRDAWASTMLETLDLERTFPDIHQEAEALREVLGDIYSNITGGREYGPGAIERGEDVGPGNLANSIGQHRILHFKDADSAMRYNAEYGAGGILEGVYQHINAASRKLALMEKFGPNPENMIRSVIAEQENMLRAEIKAQGGQATPAQDQELKRLSSMWTGGAMAQGRAAVWFSILSGEANWPANPSAARVASALRGVQSLGKLGGASLSAIADVFIKASGMRVNGLSWGEAITKSVGQYFEGYRGDKKMLARQLGAFTDNLAAELNMRWDVNENMPGMLANFQNKFFKWSGLNWITDSGKAGYAMWLSDHIGAQAGKTFDELPAAHRALLEYHGFTARHWALMRNMVQRAEDGRMMLTPALADKLSIEQLDSFLPEHLQAKSKPVYVKPEFKEPQRRIGETAAEFDQRVSEWFERRNKALDEIYEKNPFKWKEPKEHRRGYERKYFEDAHYVALANKLDDEFEPKPTRRRSESEQAFAKGLKRAQVEYSRLVEGSLNSYNAKLATWEKQQAYAANIIKRDLRTEVMSMFSDETAYAIVEPDAKVRSVMYQGARPGTPLGEALRFMMQFKSFPVSYMQRVVGGRRWVRGDLQAGMRRGLFNPGSYADALGRDVPGAAGFAVAAFAFGYLAMTAKDLARGKQPRDITKKETIFAALMQSGGAGIIGDFFFDKVNRFGNSFAETIAGPATGEVGRAVSIVSSLIRGELADAGEGALRVAMDNMPFINLWYTREAVNWLVAYHLREMMSPGTLQRTERKMKEEYGQRFLISPAGNIKRGGGFR